MDNSNSQYDVVTVFNMKKVLGWEKEEYSGGMLMKVMINWLNEQPEFKLENIEYILVAEIYWNGYDLCMIDRGNRVSFVLPGKQGNTTIIEIDGLEVSTVTSEAGNKYVVTEADLIDPNCFADLKTWLEELK